MIVDPEYRLEWLGLLLGGSYYNKIDDKLEFGDVCLIALLKSYLNSCENFRLPMQGDHSK